MRLVSIALVLPAAIAAVSSLGACHRGAEEVPSEVRPAASAPVAAAASSAPKRCVQPTPDAPPPPVAPGPARGCPVDPHPHTLDVVTIHFPEATKGEAIASVELARTPEDRERGLMFRTSMDDSHGMLFDQGSPSRVNTFWMRNTCIPLDMIFLDEDGFVVGIVENAPTLNDLPRSVPCESSYVLEMNAGWSRRVGVRAGSRARLPGA